MPFAGTTATAAMIAGFETEIAYERKTEMDRTDANDSASRSDEEKGHSPNPVYRGENPNLQAECIYFYHLLPNHGMHVYLVDRKRPIAQSEMPNQIVQILEEIAAGLLPLEPRPVRWKRQSYLAAVLASSESKLIEDDAVEFQCTENNRKNHSFRDGRDLRELPAPFESFSAFYCFNHMKHRNGHVLRKGEGETYEVHFKHPGAVIARHRFGHDDSATNLGPPLPPPSP